MAINEFKSKFPNFNIKKLNKSNKSLTVATGEKLDVKGEIKVDVKFINIVRTLELKLIECKNRFKSLLRRSWFDELMPEWRTKFQIKHLSVNHTVTASDSKDVYLFQKFEKVFKNSGNSTITNFDVSLVVKEDATPIFHKAYTVPYALRGRKRN